MNIQKTNKLFNEIVDTNNYYNPTLYPLIYGYNVITSSRAGGKTTNELLYAIAAHETDGTNFMYVRTNKTQAVRSKVDMLFNDINYNLYKHTDNIVSSKNYVELLTHGKYKYVIYSYTTHKFYLVNDDTLKGKHLDSVGECIGYAYSIDVQQDIKSNFSDSKCDIIVYDECVDNKVTTQTTINMCNLISTVFRLRENTMMFLNCNLSAGSPLILRNLEVYEKILTQNTAYATYTTKRGTKVSVELFDVKEHKSNEQNAVNKRWYGLDIQGIENITGYAVYNSLVRELPEMCDSITETGLKLYINATYYNIQVAYKSGYQALYYISEISDYNITELDTILTDNELYAYNNAHCYYNYGFFTEQARELYKAYCRNDICYQNYLAKINLECWYSDIGKTYKI